MQTGPHSTQSTETASGSFLLRKNAVVEPPAAVATEEQIRKVAATMSDPLWRVCNIYHIVDKLGRVVPFRPTRPQIKLLRAIYTPGRKRHAVLKARRMGFSTLIDIVITDACYFGRNVQASIVDLTQPDASDKLVKKCRFAWEHLPHAIRQETVLCSNRELSWPNGSSIVAGKSARGGTNQWLHISEWGPIAHEDPKRSEEIKTGALPSADLGNIIVESTFKGGKGGHFYELLKNAQETPDHLKTEKDFWFHFFPWYEDETCSLVGDLRAVPSEVADYLREKELELKVQFTPGQKLFYAVTRKEQGIFMFREYPTTVEEAFQAPVEGAIYGDLISRLRAQKRISAWEWDRSLPVFACWDLGWNDMTVVWFFQLAGPEIRWVGHMRHKGATAADMARYIREAGYSVAMHYLPHDAANANAATGVSYKGALGLAGVSNVSVVPRSTDIWVGINAVRDLLPRSWFNLAACKAGIEALEGYHTKDTSAGGLISKEPVHDWTSHDADAMRTGAEALTLGLVKHGSAAIERAAFGQVARRPGGMVAKTGFR